MQIELLESVQRFVSLQLGLVAAFKTSNAAVTDWSRLASWPHDGYVFLDGHEWTYLRHGVGILFTRQSDACVIDVHEGLADHPNAIDAWRVYQFANSLGVSWIGLSGKSYPNEMTELRALITTHCLERRCPSVKASMYLWAQAS